MYRNIPMNIILGVFSSKTCACAQHSVVCGPQPWSWSEALWAYQESFLWPLPEVLLVLHFLPEVIFCLFPSSSLSNPPSFLIHRNLYQFSCQADVFFVSGDTVLLCRVYTGSSRPSGFVKKHIPWSIWPSNNRLRWLWSEKLPFQFPTTKHSRPLVALPHHKRTFPNLDARWLAVVLYLLEACQYWRTRSRVTSPQPLAVWLPLASGSWVPPRLPGVWIPLVVRKFEVQYNLTPYHLVWTEDVPSIESC